MDCYKKYIDEAKLSFNHGCFLATICCSTAAVENLFRHHLLITKNLSIKQLNEYTFKNLLDDADIKNKLNIADWKQDENLSLLVRIRNCADHGNWDKEYNYITKLHKFKHINFEKIEDVKWNDAWRKYAYFSFIAAHSIYAIFTNDKSLMILVKNKINNCDYNNIRF